MQIMVGDKKIFMCNIKKSGFNEKMSWRLRINIKDAVKNGSKTKKHVSNPWLVGHMVDKFLEYIQLCTSL